MKLCFQFISVGLNELALLGACFLCVQEQPKSKKVALMKCQGQVLGAARGRIRLSSFSFLFRALVVVVVVVAVEELSTHTPWHLWWKAQQNLGVRLQI